MVKLKIYHIEKSMDVFIVDKENFYYDFLIDLDCIKHFKLLHTEELKIIQRNNIKDKDVTCNKENMKSEIYSQNDIFKSNDVKIFMEYAVSIWDPFYAKYSNSFERVQKKFLRRVHYKCSHAYLSYPTLLQKYNLLDLKSRTIQMQAMFLYDVCHNKYDCPDIVKENFYNIPIRSYTRNCRRRQPFTIRTSRTNAGKRIPIRHVLATFNNNFSHIDIKANSKIVFKTMLFMKLLENTN